MSDDEFDEGLTMIAGKLRSKGWHLAGGAGAGAFVLRARDRIRALERVAEAVAARTEPYASHYNDCDCGVCEALRELERVRGQK